MGDPTLRTHVAPPANLTSAVENGGTALHWDASRDEIVGYNVYRAKASTGPYARLTAHPVETSAFQDTAANFTIATWFAR